MAEAVHQRRWERRLLIGATVGVLLLAGFVFAGWYLRSPSFERVVRDKLIAVLQEMTGGRVEMRGFHWNLSELAFEADNLTIHGLEAPSELPYVHVDRVLVRLHIISFFERRFDVQRLELQRPVVHVIVSPDGTTNAPTPKLREGKTPVQELFDLAIGHAELRDGELVLNDRILPLDMSANDVFATMSYDASAQRFDGSMRAGKVSAQYGSIREIPAQIEALFRVWHNAAELSSLKLNSQNSSVEAYAKITDFNQPQLQLSYRSSIDVAQLAAIAREPQLRGGTMLFNGSADCSPPNGCTSSGHISLRNLDYVDSNFALRKANLDSNFSFAQNRLALTRIAAHVFGGLVMGDTEIRNVLASAPPEQKRASTGAGVQKQGVAGNVVQQQGSAQLRVTGLSLNELARTISSRALPLDRLNAAGSVSGTVNLSWRDSLANTVADLALTIAAPARTLERQLAVSGSVRGNYSLRADRLELAALDLATPQAHLEASGTLGSTTAALKVNASTHSLTEFEPMLASMGNAPLPLQLAGTASFNGTLNGRLRSPEIAGHVEATNFTYIYTPPVQAARLHSAKMPAKHANFRATEPTEPPAQAEPAEPPRLIHIDDFNGDVHYSQTTLALHHAAIHEGAARLNLHGAASLDKGEITGNSEFHVQAALHNGSILELQRIANLHYPVGGNLSFSLQAVGTIANPSGRGQLSLSQAELHGRAVKSVSAQFEFANHAVELENIHLEGAHGTLAGSAAYDFPSRAGKVDLTGKSVDLADIPEVQPENLPIGGVANFTIKGSGTLDHPVINGHFEIASLVLNDQVIGNFTADAVTEGRQLTLTARSRFPKASFTVDGNVELEGDMPGNVVMHFTNLDINPFLPPRVRSQVTRHASLDGQAQITGPLKQPRLLSGSLNLQQFSVEVEHIPVKSDGPVQASLADEGITIQRCVIVSQDTHFTLAGTTALTGERRLNLQAKGALNLKLAETLYPDLTTYGISNIDVTVRGTAARPLMNGRIEIVHAGASMIDVPAGLGDLNGTLLFNQDRLEVQDLTGRMGGGHVKLGGYITFGSVVGFDLSVDGKDIRLRYAGFSATSDQTIRLLGTLQNASLTGNITVTRFAQTPSVDLQALFSQASAPPAIPNPKSPLNNIHLEVRILSTPELTVQTSLAKLAGDVDLRLRGTAARPVLLGRINIAEGDVRLAGTKYHLQRGDVTFSNPVRIDPVLDVEATTRVRDYDITIGLHGTLERLNTTYRSDPPLSTDDIISLLAFGRTQTEQALGSTTSAPGFAESASGALLSSALNQAVTNRVSKIFGSSTIRINPAFGGWENDPNARLTLEQQVSNDITFTYITNLARSAQEVIQFEYNINSEYTVQGIRDENGVVSFDLLIRKRRQ